jgi:hypothetical protein
VHLLIHVYAWKGRFFVPTVGLSEEGVHVDGDPWTIVDTLDDVPSLIDARLATGNPRVPLPVWYEGPEWTGADATGEPRWASFARSARLFCLAVEGKNATAFEAALKGRPLQVPLGEFRVARSVGKKFVAQIRSALEPAATKVAKVARPQSRRA